MSAIIVAQAAAQIVGLPTNDPADVESDARTAARGTLNVNIPGVAGIRGFLTIESFYEADTSLPTPTNGALASTSAGALAATTYYVRTTLLDENGTESPLSAETSQANALDTVLNVAIPTYTANANVVAWRIYVSNTAGGGSGAETLQVTLPIGTTTWQEPTTGLVAGIPLPNQLTGLVNGPATVTISQGAGTITVAVAQ